MNTELKPIIKSIFQGHGTDFPIHEHPELFKFLTCLTLEMDFEHTYLKLASVCKRYDIGKTWIYDAYKEGRFPKPIKIGGNSRWRFSDLILWEVEKGLKDIEIENTLPAAAGSIR